MSATHLTPGTGDLPTPADVTPAPPVLPLPRVRAMRALFRAAYIPARSVAPCDRDAYGDDVDAPTED